MIDIDTAYKIGDRMARPWQRATAVLSLTVAGLLAYLLLSNTVVVAEINAEDIKAAVLNSVTSLEEK